MAHLVQSVSVGGFEAEPVWRTGCMLGLDDRIVEAVAPRASRGTVFDRAEGSEAMSWQEAGQQDANGLQARLPVLMVLHQENSTPGRIGRLLQERGHRLDLRRPRYGDPLPDTMEGHAGAVIFGGPMSANDNDEFVLREIAWIGVALREAKPLLGLCLGAQMMARHLGARVYTHPDGRAEIGYYPVVPTEHGLALSAALGASWPGHVYHWHREGFDCPPCSRTLATGDDFPTQAMKIGPAAYGLQFHPEVTHAMMCRWTVRGSERLAMPGAQDRSRQIEGRLMHDPAVRIWLDAFLDHWLAGGRRIETPARAAA